MSKAVRVFAGVLCAYSCYWLFVAASSLLRTFDASRSVMWGAFLLLPVLFLVVGGGLWAGKRWVLPLYWSAFLIALIAVFAYRMRTPLLPNIFFLAINGIILIAMSALRKRNRSW